MNNVDSRHIHPFHWLSGAVFFAKHLARQKIQQCVMPYVLGMEYPHQTAKKKGLPETR